MSSQHVIAIDLGASSGRVMEVHFDGSQLSMVEAHRFANTPVQAADTLYWDVLRLWHEITEGLKAASPAAMSIGVDTWGVDFALLDRRGELLANPIHYRDKRTDGAMEWTYGRMPRREIFERTGIQFIQLNGLYQLASLVRDDSPLLDAADTLLTIADLFNYWLSGSKTCEFTEVTTLQLYNPTLADWDRDIMAAVGIPDRILTPIVMPGTRIGNYQGTPVVVPACHDTGSAVVAVPSTDEHFAYLSSGTWSLLGLELREAVITEAAYEANVTNEGGVDGTYRLLKNIMGLWLVQQCRDTWRDQGHNYSFESLVGMAQTDDIFRSMFDPDDGLFFPPGDMPARIRQYCERTSQPIPETPGQIMAAIFVSLAYKYRYVLDQLIDVSGRRVDRLHIIGGGSQNTLLCQMTANAIGRPVVAGPTEATALGNGIVQFIAAGEIAGLAEAREILSRGAEIRHYDPADVSIWEENYQRFKQWVS